MIGILGGMGTQAGLDFSTKLAKLYRGKLDQKYPLFVLYNKSNVPKRLSDKKFYKRVFKSLLEGCVFLQKNRCKFITIPCNTAHHWYDELNKRAYRDTVRRFTLRPSAYDLEAYKIFQNFLYNKKIIKKIHNIELFIKP